MAEPLPTPLPHPENAPAPSSTSTRPESEVNLGRVENEPGADRPRTRGGLTSNPGRMRGEPGASQNPLRRWAFTALGLTGLFLALNVWFGPLNQDEGWGLYAARRVMAGEVPHRDFFYTQGLLYPMVYAAFGWAWSGLGVLGGRLLTALFGLAALFLADGCVTSGCRRLDERWSARVTLWCLLGLNLWFSYFTVIPKGYALCTLGIAGALRLMTGLRRDGSGLDPLCAVAAGALLALLADVRLSMGALLPAVTAWLWWRREQMGRWAWLWFGGGAAAGLVAAFGPELIGWPAELFAAIRFHGAREPMGLLGRAGCVARWLRYNPLLAFWAILLGWLQVTARPALKRATSERECLAELWLWCAAALALVHLCAPVPYDDYQVPATLPLTMAVAFAFTRLPFDSLRLALAKVMLPAALAMSCLGSPLIQDWVALPQDRFWIRLKAESDLSALRRVGRQVRAWAAERGERVLWTQETYLAVEAGLEVPRGLEMGPFSPPFAPPGGDAPKLAAWAGYTYALHFPDLAPAPDRAERLAHLRQVYPNTLLEWPDFGQGHTPLTIAER